MFYGQERPGKLLKTPTFFFKCLFFVPLFKWYIHFTLPRQQARSDPRRDLSGQLWALWDSSGQGLARSIPRLAQDQPRVWANNLTKGQPSILVRARSNPVIGPVQDLTGHSGHARSNPVRAPAGSAIWVLLENGGRIYTHFDSFWAICEDIGWSIPKPMTFII